MQGNKIFITKLEKYLPPFGFCSKLEFGYNDGTMDNLIKDLSGFHI